MKRLMEIIFIAALMMFVGCTTDAKTDENCGDGITCNAVKSVESSTLVEISPDVEKIEVYHFHGTNQCLFMHNNGRYGRNDSKHLL